MAKPTGKKKVPLVEKLDRALEITNTALEKKDQPTIEVLPAINQTIKDLSKTSDVNIHCLEDYEYASNTFYVLIEKGNETINSILGLADELDSPSRAYEVAANTIKIVSEVATSLIVLQEKMAKLTGMKPATIDNPQQENKPMGDTYVFAGTNDDILKLLKDSKGK